MLKTQYPRIMSDADTVLHMKGPRSADDFLNPNTQEKSWSMAKAYTWLLKTQYPRVMSDVDTVLHVKGPKRPRSASSSWFPN